MKKGIHPKYYPEAKVICACGNVFTVGATVPEVHTDVCSKCHPFFTGEQRIVDTGGQVERFKRRLAQAQTTSASSEAAPKERAGGTPTPGKGRVAKAQAVPKKAKPAQEKSAQEA